jgi:anti-anti-sigma factor
MRTPHQFTNRFRRGSTSVGENRGGSMLAGFPIRQPADGETAKLRVRVVGEVTIAEIRNAAFLFDQEQIQAIGRLLRRIVNRGHHRLLVNLAGVRSMSCEVLATLAGLYRELRRHDGRLALCGLQPQFRDMIRICRLDGMLEMYSCEAEALHQMQ